MKKLLTLIILLLSTMVANAQSGGTIYATDRAVIQGTLPNNQYQCTRCRPLRLDDGRLGDGAVRLRFHDVSINSDTDKITFTIQMRKTLSSDRYLLENNMNMRYSVDAFGADLNTPALTADGSAGSQCSYQRSRFILDRTTFFEGTNVVDRGYNLTFAGGEPDELSINDLHTSNVNSRTPSSLFAQLTNTRWEDYITMTCDIIDTDQDAGIAIFAGIPQIPLADFGANGQPPFDNRQAFTLVENDLRGFRLDGKTWARDYSRHGDGLGVRLELSKGVAVFPTASGGTAATAQSLDTRNFMLVTAGADAISTVTHVVGSPYVDIQFNRDQIIAEERGVEDILRLVSTSTYKVYDVDSIMNQGTELVNGNFLAAPNYDSTAPRVERYEQDGNEYTLFFSGEISDVTVNPDGSGLCVTESSGVCVAEGETPTVPITSVTTNADRPTTLTVVVQADGAKTGGIRSIEFRRNAILGTNLAIVTDYQPALRNIVMVPDIIGAVTTVTRVALNGSPASGNLDSSGGNYTMYFRVEADEPVPTLGVPGSYQVVDQNGDRVVGGTLTLLRPQTSQSTSTNVILQYTIPVSSERADLMSFTLARGADSGDLVDTSGNPPTNAAGTVIAVGTVITDDASARATRNTDGSTITVSSVSVVPANDGLSYTLNYRVEVTSGGPVDGIGNFNFYTLSSNGRTVTPDMSSVTGIDDGSGTDATFTYTLTYVSSQYDDVRAITGWTLTPTLNRLVNSDGNSATVGSNQAATRDTRLPVITVVDSPAPTLASNQFTVIFTVTADEPVATLNDPTSYALYRFEGATRSLVSGASPMPTSGSNNERTTLTYVVTTLTEQQVADTTSFALYRASGNKLLDASGNLPLRSRGPDVVISDTGAVSSEITPAERADTVTDSTNITVAVVGETSEGDIGATPDPDATGEAQGNQYTMSFTVTNNDHATRPIDDLATPGSYKILREDVNDERITSLTIVDSSGSATDGVATLEFTISMPNQAVTEATEGFKLERADSSTALLDDTFGRPPTISGDTIANRDTTRPNLTVVPDDSPTANGVVYSFDFEVTASEAVRSSEGAVNGLGDANSYILLVAEREANVAGGGVPSTRYAPTVDFSPDRPTTATVRFSGVDASVLQSDLSFSNFPYGLMLGRANNGLRDLANNDPVQTNAGGTRTTTEVGNNQLLQAGQVVLLDRVAPRITVATSSNDLMPNSSDQYVMEFTVTANEPVRNIANVTSYRLIRVKTNEDREVFTKTDGTNEVLSGIASATVARGTHDELNEFGQSSVFTYTVTFTGSGTTRLTNIRETKGFTLALVSGTNRINLQDVATNLPVKNDSTDDNINDSTPIYNTDDPPALINNGLIPTITGGVIDPTAVATIEKDRPVITITKTDAVANASDLYTMTFTVTSSEPVPDIADRSSYIVRRVRDNNTFQSAGDLMNQARASIETNSMNTSATITLRRDLSTVSGGPGEIMMTRGFTLLRANNSLIDRSGNLPVKAPGTPPLTDIANDAPIGPGTIVETRFRVADSAVALRETTLPVITVNADPDQATVAANVRRYMGGFQVTSNDADPIRNINEPTAYQLMRVPMTGDPVLFSGANTLAFSSGRITFDATFSDTATDRTLIRNTRGFTLARRADADGNDLTDNARNPAVAAGAVLDTSSMAVATIDKTPARFSVVAGGMANPASGNGNQYGPMAFTVTSTEVILGIGTPNSYAVLRVMADGMVEMVPDSLVTARTSSNVDGDEAQFEFTVNYGPNTNDAAVALAQRTAGFTLGRAGDDDACNLCDNNSNLPTRIDDGSTINENTRIDNRPAAVARRDTVPPSIDVTNAPEVLESGSVNTGGWELGFKILRSGIQGADSPDGVQGLSDPTSYRILGRSRTGNTYTIIPYTFTRGGINDIPCTSPDILLDRDVCRVISTQGNRVDIPASQARDIQSFVLGRAPGALRDFSNNEPVVANDDQDPARIVATGPDGSTALPLDLTGHSITLDRSRPSFMVAAEQLSRTGTTISGAFSVRGTRLAGRQESIIDEILNPSSYQLLRITRSDGSVARIANAITGSGSGDGARATINFEVTDNTADLARDYQYTLARLANLTDKEGDEPIYDAITTGTTIAIGQPLDLRPAAFADIPAVDTNDLIARIEATTLTVIAAQSNADPNNGFTFSGTFVVNTNKDVPNIENEDAYQLARVISGGTANIDATLSFSNSNSTSTVTIGYETTVDSIADVQATTGFTLAPTSMFVDVNGAAALNNEFVANEDDDPTIAMRELDSPVLSALDQDGTRPTFASGPLVMTPAFRVQENNDDTIRGIDQAGSYQLLRLAGSVGSLREVALTAVATIGGSNADGQLVSVPVTLSDLDELRGTFGFALARMGMGNLTDLSGNAPLGTDTDGTTGSIVRTGSRIDLRDTAIWTVDSTQPDITVIASGMAEPLSGSAPTVYRGTFRVSSGEVIRNINSSGAYKLLRRTVGGNLSDIEASITIDPSSLVGDITNGYMGATVSFRTTLTTAILRATGNDETAGFALGNALTDSNGLQDISGNLPVTYTADSLDPDSNAVTERDTTAPTLTVTGQAAMATGPIQYMGSFRVSSTEGAIRNLQTPGSYNLALITARNQIVQISATSATITVSDEVGSVAAGYTEATVNFTANLSESIVTATGNNALRGFILASATSTGLDGLRDLASNEVTTFRGNNRLLSDGENVATAISEIDRMAPVITVVAQNTEGDQAQLTYRGAFEVTAPSGNPIRNLNNSAVYRLLRQSIAGDISGITARLDVTTSTVSADQPDYYNSATISFATILTSVAQLDDTAGFTLGENRLDGFRGLQDINGNRPNTTPPLRRLDSRGPSLAGIEVTEDIECAAFYPNIGQNELFFEVISESAFDQARLTLTQLGTTSVPVIDTVEQIGTTTEVVFFKATLTNEITGDGNITVSYAPPGSDNFSVDAICEADLAFDDDEDGDGRRDIVDNNPFDPNDDTVNLNVATTGTAVNTLLSSTFYSREVLVRSLIRGEAFTYVEEGIKKEFTEAMTLTPNQYFGINGNDNTQVFVTDRNDDCIAVLGFSRTYNLSKVKLDEFCDIGDGMIDFLNQPLFPPMLYVWADIDENGRLIGGNYINYTDPDDYSISILPEVNFSGQSSYIYTEETSKTVVVSAYRPFGVPRINVVIKSQSNQGTIFTDQQLTISGGIDIISGTYNAISGERGETITHWLSGDGVDDLWYPTEATLAPREGGYDEENDFVGLPLAVGPDSFIDVRVASDGDNEPITRINQILLYDVTGVPFRVNSVVSNRVYYLVADVTTNESDVIASPYIFMDGYSEIATTMTTISVIQNAGHLIEQEDLEIIALRVDNSTATGTITVGWDSINSVQNVLATYRVTPTAPDNYELFDNDNDRIPNILDLEPDNNTRLQVAVGGNINIPNDYLREHNDGQPLYASDEGLIIAADMGNDSPQDYSVANIDSDTAMLTILGLDEAETREAINTIATFGVRSVDYAYTQVSTQTNAMAMGGMVHAIFPIPASSTTSDLYISHYNVESERWERFERGTNRDGFADTWYVVDRSGPEPCPTDIQFYANVHQATGDDDMGFTAQVNMPRCVMLAITDGGPYDGGSMGQGAADEQSGADGRINSLIGIGAQLNPSSRGLECAAIYPNIGQRDLFFEMNNISPDGTFEIAGATIRNENVSSVPVEASEADPVLRVRLAGDITASMINVRYTVPNGEEFETMCMASLTEDSDRDTVVDIADASPFNMFNDEPNPDTTGEQTTTLAAVDAITGEYYSRDVVIRSLLRNEEFVFIEEVIRNEDIGGTFTADMAIDQEMYFGVNANANTQIFRIEDGSECDDILETARVNNLNGVRIGEFEGCDQIVTDFNNEPVGSYRYVWADVRNGVLVASDYPDYNLNIVPELNFSGQPTYIFPEPTTRTVFISAYVGNNQDNTPSVRVRAQSREDDYSEDVTVDLTDVSQRETIRGRYNVAYHDNGHPFPGETIVRWLAGTDEIWAPTSTTLTVRQGGYDLSNISYAIGSRNNINVRVADPVDEEVTRIRQILLYENTGTGLRRATSVVSDRNYYVVADYSTNKVGGISADNINVDADLENRFPYTIATITTPNRIVLQESIRAEGDVEEENYLDIIEIMASSIENTTIITVGWDEIGSVKNIRETYLITQEEPLTYEMANARGNLFTQDTLFTAENSLPVDVADGDPDVRDVNIHVLRTHDGELPVFFTHQGIAVARDKGGDMGLHYSAANIKFDDISTDTRTLLRLQGTNANLIDSIATFGVSDVAYGFNLNEDGQAEVTGGTVFVVFPITVDDSTLMSNRNILYLSKHNNSEESPRWRPFERNTEAGTWYAIERTDTGVACPTDIQVYINEHRPAGTRDRGFMASAHNCIMLVINDGNVYDASSLDSRVIDPVGIGGDTTSTPTPRRGGGGGGIGAVGISDALLLVGIIALLLIATAKRRRKQTIPTS